MGACAHCECEVYRGDPFVVTLSDKLLHIDCIQPHFDQLRAPPVEQPTTYTVGDESPF